MEAPRGVELPTIRPANRILGALPPGEYTAVRSSLEPVVLERGTVLHAPGETIRHVYFPTRGVASLVATDADGSTIDTALIGPEGMVGLDVFLGSDRTPLEASVLVGMRAERMAADDLRAAARRLTTLVALLHRYCQVVLVELAQLVLCNRAHPLEQRIARWLLQVEQRLDGGASFPATQQLVSQMVGAGRPPVTGVLGSLRQRGLIAYERDRLTIIDPAGLERASCECYRIIRGEHERLLGAAAAAAARGVEHTSL